MVPSLTDAVAILKKWKEDSAEVLVVCESPFQQSRRGVLEQSIDWSLAMQGKIAEIMFDVSIKGKKAAMVVLEATSGKLSLSIGHCAFVSQEPREAKPDVRVEVKFAAPIADMVAGRTYVEMQSLFDERFHTGSLLLLEIEPIP